MPPAVRHHGPLALAVVGCLLLVVAEFTPLYSIRAITVTLDDTTAGAHHGYALLVIALASAAMAVGAVRGGSRPAAVALLVLSLAALLVVLAVDLPAVDEEGVYGRNYEAAQAQAEIGFRLETLGAIVLLFSAVLVFVTTPFRDGARPLRRRERAEDQPASAEETTPAT